MLENCFLLNEQRLLGELKYTFTDLILLGVYMVAAGETIVIGPSGGSSGGAAVEVALALGANVIALGRNKQKLEDMKLALESRDRLQQAVMTGDAESDAAAIKEVAPVDGVDVYNDWTHGNFPSRLHLSTASHSLKGSGRIVLSSGARRDTAFPHAEMLDKKLKMMLINMVQRCCLCDDVKAGKRTSDLAACSPKLKRKRRDMMTAMISVTHWLAPVDGDQ